MKLKSFSRRGFLRTGAVAGAGVIGLAALAGCGEEEAAATEAPAATTQAPVAETTAQAADAKPASISLEWWHQALIQMDDALKLIVKDYMALNPHVKLTLNQFPFADFAPKLLTSLAGGVSPDINYVHPQFVVQMAANGVIEPLDEYMKADAGFDRDDFHSGSLEAMSYKGKAYTVPMFHGPWLYIYYKPLLEKAGLELPWDLHQKGEWTLDKYQSMIETLSTGEGDSRVWGGTEVPAALKLQYLWIWGFGGKVWDNRGAFDDPNEFVANSPEGVEAMQWMVDQVNKRSGSRPGSTRLPSRVVIRDCSSAAGSECISRTGPSPRAFRRTRRRAWRRCSRCQTATTRVETLRKALVCTRVPRTRTQPGI